MGEQALAVVTHEEDNVPTEIVREEENIPTEDVREEANIPTEVVREEANIHAGLVNEDLVTGDCDDDSEEEFFDYDYEADGDEEENDADNSILEVEVIRDVVVASAESVVGNPEEDSSDDSESETDFRFVEVVQSILFTKIPDAEHAISMHKRKIEKLEKQIEAWKHVINID